MPNIDNCNIFKVLNIKIRFSGAKMKFETTKWSGTGTGYRAYFCGVELRNAHILSKLQDGLPAELLIPLVLRLLTGLSISYFLLVCCFSYP